MTLPEKSDPDVAAEVPSAEPDSKKQRRIQHLDGAIKYYASKMHMAFTIIGTVFGIVELNYGTKYNGQCPIQPMIVIFLIVHGSVMLLESVVGILAILISRMIYTHNQVLARRLIFAVILFIIFVNLFCLAWFIAGSVWVFGAIASGYQNTDSTNMSTYCEIDLYRAAFGIIISRYIIVTIIIVVILVHKRHDIIRICRREKAPAIDGTKSAQM